MNFLAPSFVSCTTSPKLLFVECLPCGTMWWCASGAAGPREGLSLPNDMPSRDTSMVIFLSPEQADIGQEGPTRPKGGHHVAILSEDSPTHAA